MLIPGHRYTKDDLYNRFAVPVNKQKGSWNTGYLKFNDEVFIFANIGVAGRTGHDYDNHWEKGDLIWRGKTASHSRQPLIALMLQPQTTIHLFTRDSDRNPFTYQGLVAAKSVNKRKVPIEITWEIIKGQKNTKTVSLVKDEVDEATLSKNVKQAKNDDINLRVIRSYKQRKGQRQFSNNLFIVCKGKCCITGCSVPTVLHACHIIPHAQSGNNNTSNGLLLRSDIHDLFDLHLIGIHPITLKIHIKQELQKTEYASLNGKILLPRLDNKKPNREALKKRWQLFKQGLNKKENLIPFPRNFQFIIA